MHRIWSSTRGLARTRRRPWWATPRGSWMLGPSPLDWRSPQGRREGEQAECVALATRLGGVSLLRRPGVGAVQGDARERLGEREQRTPGGGRRPRGCEPQWLGDGRHGVLRMERAGTPNGGGAHSRMREELHARLHVEFTVAAKGIARGMRFRECERGRALRLGCAVVSRSRRRVLHPDRDRTTAHAEARMQGCGRCVGGDARAATRRVRARPAGADVSAGLADPGDEGRAGARGGHEHGSSSLDGIAACAVDESEHNRTNSARASRFAEFVARDRNTVVIRRSGTPARRRRPPPARRCDASAAATSSTTWRARRAELRRGRGAPRASWPAARRAARRAA